MLNDFGTWGASLPSTLFLSARNFVVTVWDPRRSDVRQGVNVLLRGALRNRALEPIRRFVERRLVEGDPALADLYEKAYDPDLDLERLAAFPEGSLGREYARFMRDNGIEPLGDLLEAGVPRSVIEYALRRAYKLHDVMHVVLGCDTSILGEVQIVSYSAGQARGAGGAANLALIVLFLHLALRNPLELGRALGLAVEWVGLGARTKLYVGFPIEDFFDRPVSEVREMVLRGTSSPLDGFEARHRPPAPRDRASSTLPRSTTRTRSSSSSTSSSRAFIPE